MYESLFGSKVAEKCLLYIANYGEGYATAIARTFGYGQSQVQRQLEKLEAGGVLVSSYSGKTKNFKINPRLAIRKELQTMLEKMLSLFSEKDTQKYFRQRMRPRRTNKEL
jgi:DNA-binding MarR family transcriptional regulator